MNLQADCNLHKSVPRGGVIQYPIYPLLYLALSCIFLPLTTSLKTSMWRCYLKFSWRLLHTQINGCIHALNRKTITESQSAIILSMQKNSLINSCSSDTLSYIDYHRDNRLSLSKLQPGTIQLNSTRTGHVDYEAI